MRWACFSFALLAYAVTVVTAQGQTLATGELGSSSRHAVEARSRLAAGVPLFREGPFTLNASLSGAGWMGAGLGVTDTGAGYATANATLQWRGVSLRFGSGGAWDGAGLHGLSLGALGVSLARGPLALKLSLTEERLAAVNRIVNLGQSAVPVDTPGVPPSGSNAIRVSSGGGLWRGVRGEVSWSGGRFDARLAGGAQLGRRMIDTLGQTHTWLHAEATGWITHQVGVTLGVGSESPYLLAANPPGGPLTVAVRVAFGRSGKGRGAKTAPPDDGPFVVRSLVGDLRVIRLRLAHAAQVELTADFLDWRVLSFTPAGAGVWEVRVAIPPGRHRVSIRIDGGPWIVPPGLPAIDDDFTAASGLLRVE